MIFTLGAFGSPDEYSYPTEPNLHLALPFLCEASPSIYEVLTVLYCNLPAKIFAEQPSPPLPQSMDRFADRNCENVGAVTIFLCFKKLGYY